MASSYRPMRLYRGTTYVVSVAPPVKLEQPVIYDHEGFPVRWAPAPGKPKAPMGFVMRRDES